MSHPIGQLLGLSVNGRWGYNEGEQDQIVLLAEPSVSCALIDVPAWAGYFVTHGEVAREQVFCSGLLWVFCVSCGCYQQQFAGTRGDHQDAGLCYLVGTRSKKALSISIERAFSFPQICVCST